MIHTRIQPTTTLYYISLPSEWREWHYKFSLSRGFDTCPLLVMVTTDGVWWGMSSGLVGITECITGLNSLEGMFPVVLSKVRCCRLLLILPLEVWNWAFGWGGDLPQRLHCCTFLTSPCLGGLGTGLKLLLGWGHFFASTFSTDTASCCWILTVGCCFFNISPSLAMQVSLFWALTQDQSVGVLPRNRLEYRQQFYCKSSR